jgi:hypothetical protein
MYTFLNGTDCKKKKTECVWGSGCIDPHFLDLGTSWVLVVSFTPWPLYPRGKDPRYPLDRKLGGPQSRSGRCGAEKVLDPTRNFSIDLILFNCTVDLGLTQPLTEMSTRNLPGG